ncbi:hypothetical protein JNJ66_02135 [Candidatus Saccharibacteria bacterium]|nr:hypothetical protein [Candidatus Saccharibacteria bacterium]
MANTQVNITRGQRAGFGQVVLAFLLILAVFITNTSLTSIATLGTSLGHHSPARSAMAHGSMGGDHPNPSCATACMLAKPTRRQRIGRILKKLQKVLTPLLAAIGLSLGFSALVDKVHTSAVRVLQVVPAYRLVACYIS